MLVFASPTPKLAEATLDSFTVIVDEGTSLVRDQPWSSLVSIRSMSTRDAIATVVLETVNPGIGITSFYQRDTLLVTGQ